ncbi:MAG: C-GCAxxG-C-C family (seleno)protein [Candidatus Omnitrophota bacterium]
MKETAKAYFLGKKGPRRLNCAQSVAETFREQFPLEEKITMLLSACGGGMAPEGYCGAFYAAKCLLDRHFPNRTQAGMAQLHSVAGSLKCREIKTLKKLLCVGCVEKAAEVVEGK